MEPRHVINQPVQALDKLTIGRSLHAARKFRSPAIGALLTLTIILGKAIVCQHAPGRTVFFDAMLLVPVSLLAYHEGLAMGLIAGLITAAADVVIGAKMFGLLVPQYLSSFAVRTDVIARLFSFEVVASVVAALTHRARRRASEAEHKAEEYVKKLHLLEVHTEEVERDARDQQAEFEKSLLNYSSLVYLLEESAQKIYSNLETDRLFQSLFRVLEECFGATCSSVYFKDTRNGSYLLANASGDDNTIAERIPAVLPHNDPIVLEMERHGGAVQWTDERFAGQLAESDTKIQFMVSGSLMEKGEPIGIINIHSVDNGTTPDAKLMAMVSNIASIAMANARLFSEVQWLAKRDPLTKLYNRRVFHDRLESQIKASHTASASDKISLRKHFALIMLDIDHFKSFNDTYGHQAGDAVLEWFAGHCEECIGDKNTAFRYGGEEFTVIMPSASIDKGRQLAETIRSRIEKASFRYEGMDLKVTLSCGVAAFPDHGDDGDKLVRKADRAMYKAKQMGRNTVAVPEKHTGYETTMLSYPVRPTDAAPGGGEGEHDPAPKSHMTSAK